MFEYRSDLWVLFARIGISRVLVCSLDVLLGSLVGESRLNEKGDERLALHVVYIIAIRCAIKLTLFESN